MRVIDLVLDKMASNSTAEQMAAQFPPLTLAQIHSALAYYYDHKPELDAQIDSDRQRGDDLRARARPGPSRDALLHRLARGKSEGRDL